MMEWTDRHFRFFLRQITRHTLLYTEMVTASAIVHGDRSYLLAFNPEEQPVALQVGGSEPDDLAEAARIGQDFGYAEINLNVGCPSDRVQSGRFGACLMAEPELVAECVAAMQSAVDIPVTVKTRIGIDDTEGIEFLMEFVDTVSEVGCRSFAVHARKAWLKGLSPKQNREVPPLCYDVVHELKNRRPDLEIIINGGIENLDAVEEQLRFVDGAMIGRAAYHDPWSLADADSRFFRQADPFVSRAEVIEALLPYVSRELGRGTGLHSITRHVLGLYHGQRGARRWRQILSERAHADGAGIDVFKEALAAVEQGGNYSVSSSSGNQPKSVGSSAAT